MCVGHRLQRREGLRGDDEKRLGWVEIADRFRKVGAIHVGNEPEGHVPIAVMLERLVRHHRTEIGSTDTDVNDVANALAGMTFPGAAPDTIAEIRHLVEHSVDGGHDVFTVYHD